MLYKYNDIKTLHLEVTDKCNAACPMCARNINGGEDNPQLPEVELTAIDVETMFPVDFV
jgi:MoaA/NifB/PqqE/SkfB family radical SAM enzyme